MGTIFKYHIAILLALSAFVGCMKDEMLESGDRRPETQQVINSCFTGSFADNPDETDSAAPQQVQVKTSLNPVVYPDGEKTFHVQWETADRVSIFDTDGTEYQYMPTDLQNNNYLATLAPGSGSGIAVDESKTYYAAQPYSADNSINMSEKSITMTIPTVQTQKAGSLPLHYSVSESFGSTLKFYNVCGLLGFELTRSDIVGVAISANEVSDPIYLTGTVKVDCSNIEEPSWSIVEGKGVQDIIVGTPGGSGMTPGWYYVAALPQTFPNGLTFTIIRNDGKIAKRRLSSQQVLGRSSWLLPKSPLDASIPEAQWKKIGATEGEHISNALELQSFLMVADKYAADETVYFDADIDMTGYSNIAPATTFKGTLCGKNPNDNTTIHKITNWTTKHPLFKSVAAGATVGDFIIDQSSRIILNTVDYGGNEQGFGVVANECLGTLSNITNNADAEFAAFQGHYVGLLCGVCRTETGKILNCTNTGNVTYNGPTTQKRPLYFGMIAGRVNAEIISADDTEDTGDAGVDNVSIVMMEGCTNLGNADIRIENGLPASLYVTGISAAFQNRGGVSGCVNGEEGNDNVGKIYVSCPSSQDHLHVSGITFYSGAPVTGCWNHGNITCLVESAEGAADGVVRGIGVSGISGYMGYSGYKVSNNHNTGDITFRAGYSGGYRTCGQIYYYGINVGGVFGAMRSCAVSGCTNSGAVSCKLGCIENTTYVVPKVVDGECTDDTNSGLSRNTIPAVGGVLASSWGNIDNCTNNGAVTAEFHTSNRTAINLTNDSTVGGETYNQDYGNELSTMVGGVVGGDYHAVWSKSKDGDKYNDWKAKSARKLSNYTLCSNGGSVTASSDAVAGVCYCGGVIGFPSDESSTGVVATTTPKGDPGTVYVHTKLVTDCSNSGSVEFYGKGRTFIGGVSGGSANHIRSTNTGTVTLTSGHGNSNVGGISGYIRYHEFLINGTASGTVESKVALKNTDHVGNNNVGGVGGVVGGVANTVFYMFGTTVDCTVKVPYVSSTNQVTPWAVGQVVGVADQNKTKNYNGATNDGTTLVLGQNGVTVTVGTDATGTDGGTGKRYYTGSQITITGGARVLGGTSTSVTSSNFGQYVFPWKGTTRSTGFYGPNISWYVKFGSTTNSYTATGSVPNA